MKFKKKIYNLNKTFSSFISQQSNIREIIPEFFTLPEMFININKLNLENYKKLKRR